MNIMPASGKVKELVQLQSRGRYRNRNQNLQLRFLLALLVEMTCIMKPAINNRDTVNNPFPALYLQVNSSSDNLLYFVQFKAFMDKAKKRANRLP